MLSHEQEFLMLSSMQIKYRKDNWLLSSNPERDNLTPDVGNNSRSLWLGNIVLKIAGCLYTNMVTYRTDINSNPYLFFWGSLTISTPGFFCLSTCKWSARTSSLWMRRRPEWESFRQRLSMQDSSTAELISSRSLQMTTQMFSSYTHTSFRTSV